MSERFLSGIQPSGALHLGNYFGAIKQHVENQAPGASFYFIANYHALTTINDPAALRANTFDAAAIYLALGLNPKISVLWRQSDVPEVTELMWLLMTTTGMGLLERSVSYKEKVEKGIAASAGLFNYPALMAADILAFDATVVPVGRDQISHVEMTKDIAQSFNHLYGKVLTIPNYSLSNTPYVPGIDGLKMSKSYNNTIPIFASGKALKKLVMQIVTDSTPLEAPKNPDKCNVFTLYSLFATDEEKQMMREKYLSSGYGYGEAKKELLVKIEDYFADARRKRDELEKNPDIVEDILRDGAGKAKVVAREVIERVRSACGVG